MKHATRTGTSGARGACWAWARFARLMTLAVVAGLGLWSPSALAQPEGEEPDAHEVAAPDTAPGRALDFVLKVINGAPLGPLPEHFSPRFIEVFGKETPEVLTSLRKTVFGGQRVVLVRVTESPENPDTLEGIISGEGFVKFLTAFVALDSKTGLIAALQFNVSGYSRQAGDWDSYDRGAGNMGGEVSFACYELLPPAADGADAGASPAQNAGLPGARRMAAVHEFKERDSLAVGGVSALWVLGAMGERVVKGELAWDQAVPIRPALACLPGGELTKMAEGTTMPLGELAARMIGRSDTTAMDHALDLVGREAAEAYLTRVTTDPRRSLPLLTMRQYLFLKLTPDDALVKAYAREERDGRAVMLAPGGEVGSAAPDWAKLKEWTMPRRLNEAGYFASVRDLCAAMGDLHRLEVGPWTRKDGTAVDMAPLGRALREDTGPIEMDPATWTRVGFKGGHEPGVLSYAWLLERDDGRWFVMAMAWNDRSQVLEEEKFANLAIAGLNLMAKHGRGGAEPKAAP